jgi:hypothetical protein
VEVTDTNRLVAKASAKLLRSKTRRKLSRLGHEISAGTVEKASLPVLNAVMIIQ